MNASTWAYRLVQQGPIITLRVVWYDDTGAVSIIEDEAARFMVNEAWREGDETTAQLVAEEQAKWAEAFTQPILEVA